MVRADPFFGYSVLLRVIVYGVVPAFTVWQFFRLRRALHVFQLEGYKRARFLSWCRAHPGRLLSLARPAAKKPLVMTSRAWRTLIAATALSVAVVLGVSAVAHLNGGWPYDIAAWALATTVVFAGMPYLLAAADLLLSPVQLLVNSRYRRTARAKLDRVAPAVVGVTGSFGKTSTKFAIARLLGSSDTALATPGSFNTPMGVCRAVNENLKETHRFFVVEMGAYGRGEIAQLCEFVRPSIGVLTAVGPAHLDRFGSMEEIRRTKYEIVQSLPSDGLAVMNVDDPEVRSLADATSRVRVLRYGLDQEASPDVSARDIRTTAQGTSLTIFERAGGSSIGVRTNLLGKHAVGHVLAAVGVATSIGRPLAELAPAIEALEPVEHRLQIVEGTGGITVIDDAYNSNPAGAEAALDVLEAMPGNRKVVVSPGIVELGAEQFEANYRFGGRAAAIADTLIVVAGVNREAIVAGAGGVGDAEVIPVDSLADAQEHLRHLLEPGDVVLFENDLPDHYEG